MKCIAIDDEPLALDIIDIFCKKINQVQLVEKFINPIDALEYTSNNDVDLIFLDIEMPHISGIQFLNISKTNCKIVFTTANYKEKYKSQFPNSSNFLYKPFSFENFSEVVNSCIINA